MKRLEISVVELDKLVRREAHLSGKCDECVIGRVQTKPVDAAGCNWRLSKIQGAMSASCLLALLPRLAVLSTTYSLIADDGWAVP